MVREQAKIFIDKNISKKQRNLRVLFFNYFIIKHLPKNVLISIFALKTSCLYVAYNQYDPNFLIRLTPFDFDLNCVKIK